MATKSKGLARVKRSSKTKRPARYYAEWDDRLSMYGVFNDETGFCKGTWSEKSDAEKQASTLNGERGLALRNPDWAAMRVRAGEYGAKAREHAVSAYEWTKPRAKAAAERAAKAAREGYEYAAPRVRSAAESAGRSIKRGSKHAAGYVGGHLSAYSARENGRGALANRSPLKVRGTKELGQRLYAWRDYGPSIRTTSAAFKAGRTVTSPTAWAARATLMQHLQYFRENGEPETRKKCSALIRDLSTGIRNSKR